MISRFSLKNSERVIISRIQPINKVMKEQRERNRQGKDSIPTPSENQKNAADGEAELHFHKLVKKDIGSVRTKYDHDNGVQKIGHVFLP